MSVEQNKATLHRIYDELYNKKNVSLVPELIAPDYHFGNNKGQDGYRQVLASWHTAFPNIHFTVDQVVGEGDWLAYRLSSTGTFKGKWRDFDPTGKEVKFTLAFFSQFKDGKLLTTFAFADTLNLYQQMGVKPPGW